MSEVGGKHRAPEKVAVDLGSTVLRKLAEAKKLVVHIAGYASGLLAEGLLPEPINRYVAVGLLFLSSVGLYKARNASPKS